jgi:hypothetical protein
MGKPRFIEGVPIEFEADTIVVSLLRLNADSIEPVFDLRIGCAKIRRPREQRASAAKYLTIQYQLERSLREQADQDLLFETWILEYRKPTMDQRFDALFDIPWRSLERQRIRPRARSRFSVDDSHTQRDERCE